MELDMADVLLGGVPMDYKLYSIRLQLKDGGIEIVPQQSRFVDGGYEDDNNVANVILQVFNGYAEEVEIEYQPASKQEDTRWGFSCDGHTLKAVIPYKFWKTYWFPDLSKAEEAKTDGKGEHVSESPRTMIRRLLGPVSPRSQAVSRGIEDDEEEAEPPPSTAPEPPASFLMESINICQCRVQSGGSYNPKWQDDSNTRQVSAAFQQMHAAGINLVQSATTRPGSDTTRVIKVKCRRSPGSPSTSDDFERAIKVRCSRPVSPVQEAKSLVLEPEPELESKLKWSRPASPIQVSEMTSKARQPSSTEASERSTESLCGTPISAGEALARAKEALARVQQMTERVDTATSRPSTSSSAHSSVDRWSPASTSLAPCLPAAEALAMAKDALAKVHNTRPAVRSMPSTPKKRVPSRSLANTEVYVRATSSIDMPPPPSSPPPLPSTPPAPPALHFQHHPPFPESRVPINTCRPELVKNFPRDTADGVDAFSRGTMSFDLSRQQHKDALVVGRVILNDSLNLDDKVVQESAFDCDEFIPKMKANNISKFFFRGKRSKELLKDIIDFISREKAAIFAQGKKYFATKRKELGLPRLECIFCVRVAPSTMDSDGTTNWKSFGDDKNWTKTRLETHQNNRILVTSATNTVG